MADKLDPLSDRSPRDASKMGSHASLYVGLVLAVIAIGIVLYWSGMV
jgi:hypothetical protein